MTPKRHHARRSFFLFENGAPTGFDLWSPDVADPFDNLPTRSSAASSAPTVTKEIVQSARFLLPGCLVVLRHSRERQLIFCCAGARKREHSSREDRYITFL